MTTDAHATTPTPGPRILMAPMNFADQPMSLVRALRRRGVDAHHLQYTASGAHALGYRLDRTAVCRNGDFPAQLAVLQAALDEGFDLYHFWQRSLLFDPQLGGLTGLDLPLIKCRGARIFHRFTGFDLRLPTRDKQVNPHSPYHHGFQSNFDERAQLDYIDMLRSYVDVFFVQDPELGQFFPEARILPRGLQLGDWPNVGVQPSARPLVVHAPSNPEVKGSNFVVRALQELSHEGLAFDFKLLERVPHAEAQDWYKRADIIVDQILIGATGVLTLEAWALGKPCVTYLRRDLFEPFYGTSELPIANATPADIKQVLKRLIKDFEWRQELAKRGRATFEAFHDIEKIADQYLGICREVLAGGAPVRRLAHDLSFFAPRLAARRVARADELPSVALPRQAVSWPRRSGVPRVLRIELARLNRWGRLELRAHNALVRTCRALLACQEATLVRVERRHPTLVRVAWETQVSTFRRVLALQARAVRLLSRLKRRLAPTARLPQP